MPLKYTKLITFIFIGCMIYLFSVTTRSDGGAVSENSSRTPCWGYYNTGKLPQHDPAVADDFGLEWQLPLQREKVGALKITDLGPAYCPTMTGRKRGPWRHRYKGIHRGHDLGVPIKRLKERKIKVQVVADGIYDGQRTHPHPKSLPKDCRPLVVYHSPPGGGDSVYTSVYCHVDPLPELKAGQQLKGGDVIGTLEDPEGSWNAHVHLEIYTRRAYSSKDSTKRTRCACRSDSSCDAKTKRDKSIPRGCGIFEDDLYLLEPVLFIKRNKKDN